MTCFQSLTILILKDQNTQYGVQSLASLIYINFPIGYQKDHFSRNR